MSNANYMVDNTDDLSSFYEGSVTNEGSVATMPTLTMEPESSIDEAADN
jgi:hypothetical protein